MRTMNPMKNSSAIEASVSPMRRLFLFCSGVIWRPASADHLGRGGVQPRRGLEGMERCRRGDFPLEAFGRFPRLLRGLLALAEHGRQHDEEEEVHLRQAEGEG